MILQNFYSQFEKFEMDEGSSNSNIGSCSFNQDLQTSNCFFDQTTIQKVHTTNLLHKHSVENSLKGKFCQLFFAKSSYSKIYERIYGR